MARRGWWRSIPPELGVPLVISSVIGLVFHLAGIPRTSAYTLIPVSSAQTILILCALLELRRRLAGTPARLVTVAAGAQALDVAQLVVSWFIYPLGIDREIWFAISQHVSTAAVIGLALVLGTAARAWRSILGPLLVVTMVLDEIPRFMLRWVVETLHDDAAITAYLTVAPVAHNIAVLAICGRLGAMMQAVPDLARAARAARRAAIAQWLRVGAVVIVLGSAVALKVLGWERLSGTVLGVALFAIAGTTAGTISGLLGLARSHIVGLSPLALCTAAFGALWCVFAGEVQAVGIYLWKLGAGPSAWFVGATLACFLCVAAGAVAIRGYAARLDDRPLVHVLSRRLGLIVALDLAAVGCLAVTRPETKVGTVGVVVSLLAFYTAANAALAGMFARLGHRLKLVAAVDAF